MLMPVLPSAPVVRRRRLRLNSDIKHVINNRKTNQTLSVQLILYSVQLVASLPIRRLARLCN